MICVGSGALQWRHNEQDSVSNHQPHNCLLNCLFRPGSNKTSKLRVTGLCAGNSPGTGEFPAQMASNAENVSIWWRHHGLPYSFAGSRCPYTSLWWEGRVCWLIVSRCRWHLGTSQHWKKIRQHDNVIKSKKKSPRYWPFVRGIHRWPVNSPHKAGDAEIWCFL